VSTENIVEFPQEPFSLSKDESLVWNLQQFNKEPDKTFFCIHPLYLSDGTP